MKITSREMLEQCRREYSEALGLQKKQILICGGSGCVAGGSREVLARMQQLMTDRGLNVDVVLEHEKHEESIGLKHSGCHGFCAQGPLMRIEPMGLLYTKVKVADCEEIVEKTIVGDEIIDRLVYHDNGVAYPRQADIPFYKKQHRVALEHCGHINAESVEECIAVGGYASLAKALFDMTPEEVIQVISDSNLRGRGGAGFPTGKKWSQVAAHKDAPLKYVICNGDEGDPGAFMDRRHGVRPAQPDRGHDDSRVRRGRDPGLSYTSARNTRWLSRGFEAIDDDMAKYGMLGENIMGSGKSFYLHIRSKGAGAFVCGEETALITSLEGKRGMPRTEAPKNR
jgi:NADH-quinone oxidoreductase subunit F